METDDGAAEQAAQDFLAPGADAEGLGIRPRNMPEGNDGRARQLLANELGQKREVVILHQDHRIVGLSFLHHRFGELLVGPYIIFPVGSTKNRALMGDMAKRPETFVRETVVVS